MDDWLGRLLERLDAARLPDDPLLIVASDHGENFGEGAFLAHALSLDNRLIHVPLVAAGPGAQALSLTSLAELPRAIAGAAELDAHPWGDGPPAGVGVAQFDPPSDDPDDPRVVKAVEGWGMDDETRRRFTTSLTCAVGGDLKLMRRGERDELYDLASDPLELSPIDPRDAGPDRAERLAVLQRALAHPSMTATRESGESAAAAGAPSADELSD